MRLTSFTDYGLRMLMRMAAAPDCSLSTAQLSEEFGLSRNHLAKIMQRLVEAGVVTTRRGAGGGARLVTAPQNLKLGDLVEILEDGQALVECFANGGGSCSIIRHCRLRTRLQSAGDAFLADLNQSTLADISLASTKI
ncbi:Rrf2 family transcriptional regulator [Hyphomonas sp.]|jgi:Rrf2 family nitric oxide-sensitive transcriptional repressor|uniref:RrF2 family transcriptional regulator n=1 Tax=Hyphomonas sp. TaxID=87 RepID=UPI001E10FF48|nr:Rrf2 family transcriptional regulator [Hyphomonas sp.]